ncbi:MAG: DUF4160 domain-containing protein [Acidobacteria bacterium]|nr:MAG: DUF4160 domain-containing protein [Acidobacteriota bacterium]REK08822.1 MAG: DUF4160 domain-containing protein [Acidobacteriota bacterium]
MPTVLREGPYRFFFYSSDRAEPPHVHVARDESVAKFWLSPVVLQKSSGFSRVELAKVESLIEERSEDLLGSWYEFFGS